GDPRAVPPPAQEHRRPDRRTQRACRRGPGAPAAEVSERAGGDQRGELRRGRDRHHLYRRVGRQWPDVPDSAARARLGDGHRKGRADWQDMEVFLQLLPRSSTAERMNPYTSFWTGVAPGDGPQEFHLMLLDNGRTKVLADPAGRQTL